MTGSEVLYTPGSEPSVRVVANAAGDIAQQGDAVEPVGESTDGTPLVALSSGGPATFGHLSATPYEYDESATYAEGDVAGEAPVYCRHYVDWLKTDGDLSVGDIVEWSAGGGVGAFDPGTGDALEVVGPVFRTVAKGEYRAGKVAVVRTR